MSSYRQMRRQARQARRVGMQPLIMINGDQFPTPFGVILARRAWHYRSELAPAITAVALLTAGLWVHLARPHWWPYLLAGTIVTTLALASSAGTPGSRGSRNGSTRPQSRSRLAHGWYSRAYSGRLHPLARRYSAWVRSRSVSRGGHTGVGARRFAWSGRLPCGRTSPARLACRARRSSPRPWTCGAGGRGCGWPAGRPSRT